VSYSFDDAYEMFGGTVDVRHMVAFGTTDDDFDSDFGYQGRMQFMFGLKDSTIWDVAGETRGFESDGNGDGTCDEPLTWPIISNLTSVGPFITDDTTLPSGENFDWSGVVRRCSQLQCFNSGFIGHERGFSVRDVSQDSALVRDNFRWTSVASHERTHDTGRWASIETWFDGLVGSLRKLVDGGIIRQISTMGLTDMSDLNDPNPVPLVGSELDTASVSFAHLDSWFIPTDYRGAFKPGVPMSGQWTYCWTNFDPQNTEYNTGLAGIGDRPRSEVYYLGQNSPNPFRSANGTTIHYSVPKAGGIQINIFDAAGRLINTLAAQAQLGDNYITWDGKSKNGSRITSGVYFYQIKTPGFTAQKKMMLVN
jgi:hypothetical protein